MDLAIFVDDATCLAVPVVCQLQTGVNLCGHLHSTVVTWLPGLQASIVVLDNILVLPLLPGEDMDLREIRISAEQQAFFELKQLSV